MVIFSLLVSFVVFWKIWFSLQQENIFEKPRRKNKRKIGQIFDSKKANFWTDFWLYSTCIYIYLVGARGGPNFDTFSAGREPRNFWKNASYRRKKQMKSCEGAPGKSCEGAKKQVTYGRAPWQPCKSAGSFAAHETLLLAEWAVRGSFSEHFRKAFREKSGLRPGSFAGFPQKEANFAKIACFEPRFCRKNAISKMCQKSGQITPPIPQKERFFRVVTSKNVRFRRKNEFSINLSKLRHKPPKVSHILKSRKTWKN